MQRNTKTFILLINISITFIKTGVLFQQLFYSRNLELHQLSLDFYNSIAIHVLLPVNLGCAPKRKQKRAQHNAGEFTVIKENIFRLIKSS